jgi:phospholipid transport system transporter-binding protein
MAQITQAESGWNLNGEVVINTASALLDASKLLTLGPNTKIDFSGVTNIDTSTISLIFEWKRRAQKENQSIQFVNLPANLNSLTQLYGVNEMIN